MSFIHIKEGVDHTMFNIDNLICVLFNSVVNPTTFKSTPIIKLRFVNDVYVHIYCKESDSFSFRYDVRETIEKNKTITFCVMDNMANTKDATIWYIDKVEYFG